MLADTGRKIRKLSSLAKNYVFSRPFYASLDITNNCNLKCEGCDFPLLLEQKKLGKDLPLEGIVARIEAMNHTFGSMVVVLAGFEPTMRKDLANIINSVSQHNYAGIVTNGTLIDRETASSYWGAGLTFASVSMPAFDDERFKEITQVTRYGVFDVRRAIETLVETAPRFGRVAITVTIDNNSTPEELEQIAAYGKKVGAGVSFQPYSSSKPASAVTSYDSEHDQRTITMDTLETVFNGSLADTIIRLKNDYPIVGRSAALRNFDVFVREGTIPFKPRALKIYANGDVALYPEGEVFGNMDSQSPEQVWEAYRDHAETLRMQGPLRASNCYRCVNLTNPSTPIGDVLGGIWRGLTQAAS